MECPRCKNKDPEFFGEINGKVYCRKCIDFKRVYIEKVPSVELPKSKAVVDYFIPYDLTKAQQKISEELLENYKNHKDSYLKAVCGAGKTEIVYECIRYALNHGQTVCFAVPRRELVIELADRLLNQFQNLDAALVYGGHHDDLNHSFIFCTTHQLYRFPKSFDLLILDEADAFPYCHDEVLENILMNSVRGNMIIMSATLHKNNDILSMNRRYHGYKLPVPKVIKGNKTDLKIKMFLLLKKYQKARKPVLIFVPDIHSTIKMNKALRLLGFKSRAISSKSKENSKAIEDLRTYKLEQLVCTTILERGITIEDVQVIIMNGEHEVFNASTLIQICGRVGRKPKHPEGDVKILCQYQTKSIRECLKYIEEVNV